MTVCLLCFKMKSRAEFYSQLRKEVGTFKYVASLLGVSERTLYRRERGEAPVTNEMVAALELFKSREKK